MITVRRIYGETEGSEPKRVLVDRLWPRGISREKANLTCWAKDVAPSTELRKWYGHDPEKFDAFREKYIRELDANPAAVEFRETVLREQERGDIVFLYGAADAAHNNAVVLRDWILQGEKKPDEVKNV